MKPMPMPRPAMGTAMAAAATTLALLLLCAACTRPERPDTERPPEPQAADALRKPIDRAKAAEGEVEDAAARQRAAIDAQAGG